MLTQLMHTRGAAGMVNLCNKNGCRGLNCHKSPRFNFPHVSRGIFCDAHKLEGVLLHHARP